MSKFKQVTLYEIREYVGNGYSKGLGFKLRSKQQTNRILKRLKPQNREFIVVPWKTKIPYKPKTEPQYQFEAKQWVDIYTFKDTPQQ